MAPAKEEEIKDNKKKLTVWDRHFGKESRLVKYEKSLTIFILIAGMIVAIAASYIGASEQARLANSYEIQKDEAELKNIANTVYLDIRLHEYALRNLNESLSTSKNSLRVYGIIYPDNGLYYSFRPEIARLKPSVVKNITVFYTDMTYAEIFRRETNTAIDENRDASYAYQQEIWGVQNAWVEEPLLVKELEDSYNISYNLSTRYQ
ncbi:MAG: hypothetical protein WC295_08680 [Methanoregula sp.]|nr:hypothetical protein [Methanoregula sp.]